MDRGKKKDAVKKVIAGEYCSEKQFLMLDLAPGDS